MIKKMIHSIKPLMLRLRCRRSDISLDQRHWESGMKTVVSKDASVSIGRNCNFRRGLQLRVLESGSLSIGESVFCNTNVSITVRKKVVIGNNVKIANNVVIIDHDHDFKNDLVGYIDDDVIIGDNVWIGANCVILRGTRIGSGCVVGAGTVLKGEYEDRSIIIARPEKIIKNY